MPDPTEPRPATLPEHRSRFRGRDGVTSDERDVPPGDDEDAAAQESAATEEQPAQLALFAVGDRGAYAAEIAIARRGDLSGITRNPCVTRDVT